MNYTPLIQWAIATGRLKDGVPRMNWVQRVVKDEHGAVNSLLAAKAAKRHDLKPPSPWREAIATGSVDYPAHLLTRAEAGAVESRRREAAAVAAAASDEYPASWLSRADHERIAKARAKRGL